MDNNGSLKSFDKSSAPSVSSKTAPKSSVKGKKTTKISKTATETQKRGKTKTPENKEMDTQAKTTEKIKSSTKAEKSKSIAKPKAQPETNVNKSTRKWLKTQGTDVKPVAQKTKQTEKQAPPRMSGKKSSISITPSIYELIEDARDSKLDEKVIRYIIVCSVVLTALIIVTSYQNLGKFFISSKHGAVEIWKGKFSPKGKELIVIMPGILPPEPPKKVYTEEDVFPIVFSYYIEKADALMEVPGMPDFVGIRSYLNRALSFAATDEQRNIAKSRLNNIDLMILLYKADVASSKGGVAGLETATKYLQQASALNPDEIETKLIEQKLESIRKLMEVLSPKPTKSTKEAFTTEQSPN